MREYLKELSDEQTQLRKLITALMWHMRGSLSREEAWTLSPVERADMLKAIEERKDITEKTGLALM